MFGIITKIFFCSNVIFCCNALKCVAINNQECKIRPEIINVNSNETFNLTSRSNETRHIEWHETCKCKCRLEASVCNDKKRWNNEKFRCECKEMIGQERCDE